MLKLKKIILSVIFILLSLRSAGAETITLQSGKVFNGEIIEKAKDYIRVKYNGLEIYYENKYNKNIENLKTDEPAAIKQEEKPVQERAAS
jgi:hypothetical protein